jgi:selenocysteine-specific elongation factor
MTVVATAGHVDHGKSSLVRALTGIDPDRFIEERQRGLTIDLGFAHTTLASGRVLSFIDVPGHVRFLRNMLAGVGSGGRRGDDGVALCVFVVDATEGWKPQSEEHLRIIDLMGISTGVVALTKADLVDDDWLEMVSIETRGHLADSALAAAPLVPVSSVTGVGLDALRTELDLALARLESEAAAAADRHAALRRPRLWIDRVFSARGAGTVVTGTLIGNGLAVDQQVIIEPIGAPARLRGIQTHGHAVERVDAGHRVALNLAGVDQGAVGRGDVVVMADQWAPTAVVDADLGILGDLDHAVSRRGAYLAYLGSREIPVRLRVLGSESLPPGGRGAVRLHLSVALPLAPGDRFVLRETGRDETIGGGEILDIAPVLAAARATPDRSLARPVRERSWVRADDLAMLVGPERLAAALAGRGHGEIGPVDSGAEAVVLGDWVVDADVYITERDGLMAEISSAGDLGVDLAALDEQRRAVLEQLVADGEVVLDAGRARPVGVADPWADHPVLEVLRTAGVRPPDIADLDIDRAGLRELIRRGALVEVDRIVFHPTAIETAAAAAADLLDAHRDGFSVSQLREALSITRKHAVPLAQALDARAVTRRRGDLRVAGPALRPSGPG